MVNELETVLAEVVELGKKIKDRHDLRAYSERLCFLCSIFLNLRYGENYNAIYPFCGLDVLTPYLLGGNWLLFDDSWSDYQTEISRFQIPYFKEALNSDRIKIIEQSIDDSKDQVRTFKPQIVLIKYAGTEGNYERIFDFLTRIIKDSPLLIISCVSRQLEKYINQSSAYQLSLVPFGSMKEISLKRQIQPDYQTFFFLDRLKLYEFAKRG
ncbi:MAG: hypothetical protein ACW98I_09340 [Candidatus Hodarchaeales archaeon]|jgi:hypothetical protein